MKNYEYTDEVSFVYSEALLRGAKTSMQLTVGDDPGNQSSIGLVPNQIDLTLGVLGVGPHVTLSNDGVKLTCGPPGAGAEIALTATGITISFMGVNKITIDSTGVSVAGLTCSVQGGASTAIKGLVTTIG